MTDMKPSDEAVEAADKAFWGAITGKETWLDQMRAALTAYLATPELQALLADARRLRQLEKWASDGGCPALINDDNGHWAVSFDGIQTVPSDESPADIQTTFYVDKNRWHDTVAAAIDAEMEAGG